jgi:hypothetical protein
MKIDGQEVHRNITLGVVLEAVERHHSSLDNPGFCIACGEEVDGCEPDARQYECECCGEEKSVYGAEELLLHMGGV